MPGENLGSRDEPLPSVPVYDLVNVAYADVPSLRRGNIQAVRGKERRKRNRTAWG